jgi:hypothetical protein
MYQRPVAEVVRAVIAQALRALYAAGQLPSEAPR